MYKTRRSCHYLPAPLVKTWRSLTSTIYRQKRFCWQSQQHYPDLFEHLVAVAIDHTPVSALALFEALLALATSHSPAKQLAEIHFDARPTSRSEGVTQFA